MKFTRLSTNGQIPLARNIVEVTGDGILLRTSGYFPETSLEDVAGCLRASGKAKTSSQMRAAIGRETIRRHESGRY